MNSRTIFFYHNRPKNETIYQIKRGEKMARKNTIAEIDNLIVVISKNISTSLIKNPSEESSEMIKALAVLISARASYQK